MKNLLLTLSVVFLSVCLNAQEDSIITPQDDLFCDINMEPQFPGGNAALKRYLLDHLKYPANCIPDDYCVKSYVRFDVLQDGTVSNIEIVRGNPDCPEFDKNVIELIKKMPKWQPATLNGKPISVPFQLPIKIRLTPD